MKDFVDETLQLWRRTPFNWSVNNCILSLADYVIYRGYEDFAADFRNKEITKEFADQYVEKQGGLTNLIRNKTTLIETSEPIRGCIIACNIPSIGDFVGLYCGKSAAFRTNTGVLELPQRMLVNNVFWRV